MSPKQLPASADAVIIGGGAIGLSAAYQLARRGVHVVVVETGSLGSGSTSKAAGGVRAQFSDEVNIRLGQQSLEAFARFEADLDQPIDLRRVGYLFLLDRQQDVDAFDKNIQLQNSLGVPSRLIDAVEAARLSPLIDTDGVLAAAYSPDDGHCTPDSVVLGFATAARRLGAHLAPHCPASSVEVEDAGGFIVRTPRGAIRTETVVCAAGAWSGGVGSWFGVDLPVTPLRRQVLVTGAVEGLSPTTPMTIDFSTSLYFHREGPGLLLGMSDPDEVPGFVLDRDDAWLPRLTAAMAKRAPALLDVGVRTGWAGLYEMTPDHNGLVGTVDLGGGRLIYATGFSGHGFLMSPALGEVVADLYSGAAPAVDVAPLDATRFARNEIRRELNVV